jgi:hypothetical protein
VADLETLIRQLQGAVAALPFGQGRKGQETVTVTWPGGAARSGFVTVTHGYGVPARVLGQSQDKSVTGATIVVLGNVTADSFDVAAETTGFQPPAGTMRDVTVVYWEQ